MTPDHRRTASARTHGAQLYCKLPAMPPCHAPSPWLTLTPKRKGARFPFKFPPLILLMGQHTWKPANDPFNRGLGTWTNAHWELDQTDGISLVISAAYSRDQADLPWWPRSNRVFWKTKDGRSPFRPSEGRLSFLISSPFPCTRKQ